MKKILKFWPFGVFSVASIGYYWQVFFRGFVPFPGDLLVGAYLPWLESKWGFITGVPVKNPIITDVMSQFYMWRSIVSEGWSNLQIPLWNPYSYSGYPLLATFHSGVLYPLNLIHLLLGDVRGWSFMVVLPSFAAACTMYLYLRQIKTNRIGSVIGGIIYAYSGFAINWALFVSAAQAMIWMPLVLFILEKYFQSKNKSVIYWIPIIFFLLVTSGHFQIMVYISVLTFVYFIWKWMEKKDPKLLLGVIIPAVLSLGLSAVQLLPTLELTRYGLRSVENYISGYNYGLLPIKYLATLIAPDYFGNPATGNYFGVYTYNEVIFYNGLLSIFGFILSLFLFKSNKYIRFFLITACFSWMLGFDTTLGKAIYSLNVPGVSTSAAGRIAVIFSFCLAILTGIVISNIEKINFRKIFFSVGLMGLSFAVIYYLARFTDGVFSGDVNSHLTIGEKRVISLHNLILPGGLIICYSVLLLLSKRWRIFTGALLVLACLEMFRFGWKYIPFIPERIVYPDTSITSFIKDKGKSEVFRIDRERAEIMPLATWMQYRFMSPSGYDPMAVEEYVNNYQEKINGNFSGLVSRFSELERYDSESLGEFNVKYLLAIKRNDIGVIGGNNINHSIDQKQWKKVYETPGVAVLENINFKERARFVDSNEGEVEIQSYSPNKVIISFNDGLGKTLLLADTWYPGWKAFVNNKEISIVKCDGIFRCVKLNQSSGEVVFDYQPQSFWIGVKISLFSLVLVVIGLIGFRKPNDKGVYFYLSKLLKYFKSHIHSRYINR